MSSIIALCGPSGAGKTALLSEFAARVTDVRIITRITTRVVDVDDYDRHEYETVSLGIFLAAIAAGELADFTENHGVLYGIRRSEIDSTLSGRTPALLVSGTATAIRLKKTFPNHVKVAFLYPGDLNVLRRDGLDPNSVANLELVRRLRDRRPRRDDGITDFDHWLAVRTTRNLSRVALLLSEIEQGLDATIIPSYRGDLDSAVTSLASLAADRLENTYSNAHLPRKRIGATALYTNVIGDILIVKPTYRKDWLTPGGTVIVGESPRQGCLREVREELGESFPVGRLLCIEYRPAHGSKVENMQLVFWGGALDKDSVDSIRLPEDELTDYKFCPVGMLDDYLNSALAHRVRVALDALKSNRTVYLEDPDLRKSGRLTLLTR